MKCSISEIESVIYNADLKKSILEDISEKVFPLKELKKKYLKAKQIEIDFGSKLARMRVGLKTEELLQMQEEFKKYQNNTRSLNIAIESIYASIWNGQDPNIRKFVERQVDNDNFDKNDFIENGMTGHKKNSLYFVLRKMQEGLRESSYNLKVSATNRDFSDQQKISIFQDSNMGFDVLKENPEMAKSPSGLYCRLNGRYGKGRDYFNTITNVATVGASILAPGALFFAAGRGLMALNSARILSLATASGLTTISTMKAYKESCESDLLNIVVDNNTCSKSNDKQSFTKKIERSNCALNLALSSINFGFSSYLISSSSKVLKLLVKPLGPEQVSLLWYPKAGYITISHVELKVGEKVYDNTSRTRFKSSASAVEKSAKMGGRGYYEFKLKVTNAELEKLKTYLESVEGKNAFQSCVSGACSVLRNTTEINIPPPFRYVPTLSAIYLTAGRTLGYSKITNIQFVGKSQLRTLLATEIPVELITANIVGYFILEGLDKSGKIIKHIIPVEVDEAR